jgi:hypothetical protein
MRFQTVTSSSSLFLLLATWASALPLGSIDGVGSFAGQLVARAPGGIDSSSGNAQAGHRPLPELPKPPKPSRPLPQPPLLRSSLSTSNLNQPRNNKALAGQKHVIPPPPRLPSSGSTPDLNLVRPSSPIPGPYREETGTPGPEPLESGKGLQRGNAIHKARVNPNHSNDAPTPPNPLAAIKLPSDHGDRPATPPPVPPKAEPIPKSAPPSKSSSVLSKAASNDATGTSWIYPWVDPSTSLISTVKFELVLRVACQSGSLTVVRLILIV